MFNIQKTCMIKTPYEFSKILSGMREKATKYVIDNGFRKLAGLVNCYDDELELQISYQMLYDRIKELEGQRE